MAIRAIIFDCFGVLVTEGFLPFRQRYFGTHPDQMQEARDLGRQLYTGLLAYEDFIQQLAHMAHITPNEVRSYIEKNVPNEQLLAYIKDNLKPRFKIGMLSNVGARSVHDLFTKQQLDLFDALALSYEMGIAKPDTKAYEIAAERLDVTPENCVFVDDREHHCQGARQAGMQAILYTDFASFTTQLEQLLANSKN